MRLHESGDTAGLTFLDLPEIFLNKNEKNI